ncbi:MAG: hypothetical protein ACQCN3_12910 [Candidatus Bathyarchaeia archaeon]
MINTIENTTPNKPESEPNLLEKINTLKKYYHVQTNKELIKILVNEKAQQLNLNPKETTTNATH